jgi:ADP-ribose pyrophosphatase
MKPWIETSRTLFAESVLFKIFKVGFRSQATGKEGIFDAIEANDWVNIVPLTRDGYVVLVRQFRFGSKEITLEFPAGGVGAGEPPLAAAKRELEEEVGCSGSSVELIGVCHPNPAFLNNTCFQYIARDVELGKTQKLDPLEELEIELVPAKEIDGLIASGKITHSLSVTAWYYYKTQLAK